jgi:hypothetical protein
MRLIAAGLAVFLAQPSEGVAQDGTQAKAGLMLWKSAGCSNCHGPFADGNNQNDDWPRGANLRVTRLDAAGLKMTITCGRPGTGMPSFDEDAYAVQPCYGNPPGAPPSDLFPAPGRLKPSEIEILIAYLQARIIGRGKITREECVRYYDGYDSELCNLYR